MDAYGFPLSTHVFDRVYMHQFHSCIHTYIMHACMHAHIMHTVWVFPYMLHICKRLNCHQ